ncbi:uncharacterized protein DS421_16g557990 [Arachis hypogaea]|nr:uncharacterized protein DS421_16g557990 [Arachis hypogaea]
MSLSLHGPYRFYTCPTLVQSVIPSPHNTTLLNSRHIIIHFLNHMGHLTYYQKFWGKPFRYHSHVQHE